MLEQVLYKVDSIRWFFRPLHVCQKEKLNTVESCVTDFWLLDYFSEPGSFGRNRIGLDNGLVVRNTHHDPLFPGSRQGIHIGLTWPHDGIVIHNTCSNSGSSPTFIFVKSIVLESYWELELHIRAKSPGSHAYRYLWTDFESIASALRKLRKPLSSLFLTPTV